MSITSCNILALAYSSLVITLLLLISESISLTHLFLSLLTIGRRSPPDLSRAFGCRAVTHRLTLDVLSSALAHTTGGSRAGSVAALSLPADCTSIKSSIHMGPSISAHLFRPTCFRPTFSQIGPGPI